MTHHKSKKEEIMKCKLAKDPLGLGKTCEYHEINRSEQVPNMAKDNQESPMQGVQWRELRAKHSETVNDRNERQRVNRVNTESQGGQRPTKSLHSMEIRKAKA